MLGIILGHAELGLLGASPSDSIYADLREIKNAAERSANLTRQLLAFARKQTVEPRLLDLNVTVESMHNMLRRLISEGIDLEWLPAADVWPVFIDPVQIDQILVNLCVNARDSITGVGIIKIEIANAEFDETSCADRPGSVPGEYVELSVSDTGCGMDRETMGKVFEPFFTTKTMGQGTGMGLATVYGIVKQNNGFINVVSEPGKGTTFRIYLPRYKGRPEGGIRARSEGRTARGWETVLYVEDEPALLNLGVKMLEMQGYKVLAVDTPEEAIDLARKGSEKIHLLVTDVIMPGMNGRELAEKLLTFHPHIKCLFMSGYTSNVIGHHGVLDEGVCFIQKPFSVEDLADKVHQALEREVDYIV